VQVIVVTQNAFRNLFLSFRIYFFHLLNVHSVHSGFLKLFAATTVKSENQQLASFCDVFDP
jgi:hypothetical protein